MPRLKTKTPTLATPLKLKKIAQDLIDHLELPAAVDISQEGEIFKFDIHSNEPATFIGYHGETLSAFQRILGMIIEIKFGLWHKITDNVGDYRERREETLRNLALSTAQRVKFSQEEAALPHLSASERRIIHLILADHPDVFSQSEGEGALRRVVVKPNPKS